MKNINFKRIKQLGLFVLGAYVVSGCPSSSATSSLFSASGNVPQQVTSSEVPLGIAVAETSVIANESNAVSFEVCAAVESWQRPGEAEQAKQLSGDSRYAALGQEEIGDYPLKRASEQFWDHDVISFTTYGLSARMEPMTLSGLWTVTDELWNCYEPETTVAINEGDRAETWLLNQRIVDLAWEEDRYLMTVESAPTGAQVVQFDRVDELATLPLEIVTRDGRAVSAVSGDWQ
ncbi:MAG: hypothetical protein AAFQ40_06375 [Cyanobacteria bacterium J06623_5]